MNENFKMDYKCTAKDFKKVINKTERKIYEKFIKKGGEIEDLIISALKETFKVYLLSNIYFESLYKITKNIKTNKDKYINIQINNEENLDLFCKNLEEIHKLSSYILIPLENITKIEY